MAALMDIYLQSCYKIKISTMVLKTILLILTICGRNIQCQMCTSLDKLPGTVTGLRVEHRGIINLTAITYMQCGIECLKRRVCVSFNYDLNYHNCMLNFEDLNTNNSRHDASYVVTSIASFPKHLAGKCENHDCPTTKQCVEIDYDQTTGSTYNLQYNCISFACPLPPMVNNAIFIGTESLTFDSAAFYKCGEDYEPFNNKNFSTCYTNGSWSEFKCKRRVRNCTELKGCYSMSLQDGEYWLYPVKFGDKRVKIYCANMSNTSLIPKSYVTLEKEVNILHKQCLGEQQLTIKHEKLAVDLQTMIINSNDTTFFHAFQAYLFSYEYGVVHNCPTINGYNCPANLLINTTGTGLLLNKTTEWVVLSYDTHFDPPVLSSVINYVNKSSDNRVADISCSGQCGGCRPLHDLSFEYDETYEKNMSDATDPVCFD